MENLIGIALLAAAFGAGYTVRAILSRRRRQRRVF